MAYNKTVLQSLIHLLRGDTVYHGKLGPLDDILFQHGHFKLSYKNGRRYYTVIDPEAFRIDLSMIDENLRDPDKLLQMYNNTNSLSRGDMASYNGNSKIKRKRTFNGFMINTYHPITTTLQGEPYTLNPIEGTFTFVYDWQHFSIPDNIIIVGIENPENYENIRCQKHLFEDAVEKISGVRTTPILFVSRYPQENSSADLRQWLMSIPNKYVHYGDFDLKGIHIFLAEFYKYLGDRASFLIPEGIEIFIKSGIRERYDAQYDYRNITSPIPEVQSLIDIIKKYKKGYDQEAFEKMYYGNN